MDLGEYFFNFKQRSMKVPRISTHSAYEQVLELTRCLAKNGFFDEAENLSDFSLRHYKVLARAPGVFHPTLAETAIDATDFN